MSAPTAPHECDVPECPGPANAAKLALFDELVAALRTIGYEPIGPSDASPEALLAEITNIARAATAKVPR